MTLRSKTPYILVLLGMAVFFSVYKLTESPGVWYDEGFYVQTAANLADQGIAGMQFAPGVIEKISHLTVGYPLIYPLALWLKIFGTDILTARSLMVLFILGFLIASFFLSRKLFGLACAVGSLAILATFPPLYGNGKTVLGEVPGLLYLALFLLSFYSARASSSRRPFWFILAGVSAGLCVVTKPIFLLLLPAIAIGVFFEWRRRGMSAKDILIAVIAGLIPIVAWIFVQFEPGVSLSFILSYYTNPSDVSNLSGTIIQNIRGLFTDTSTLYLMTMSAVWLASIWTRRKSRLTIRTEEIIALSFSILIILAYTRTAGWYRYLFEAQVVSLIFFPNALSVVAERFSILFKDKAKLAWLSEHVASVVLIVLTVLGIYQVLFHSWVADAYASRKTAYWERYFQALPEATSVFFYDTPEVALFDRSRNYYQFLQPAGGAIGREELPAIAEGIPDLIIMRTDAWHKQFKLYAEQDEVYKYTILRKIR